jgi:Zn finger protein HypA/HybF involved in hydrogenase expression
MEKISKKEKFIIKAKNKFGDKYDYIDSEYINSSTKIKIKCVEHNEYFNQIPSEHLRNKVGCNLCTRNPKVDTLFFIKKAKEIHGDRYDYNKTNYVNSNTKVSITCKKHGEFEVLPNNHYKQNCPNCYNDNRSLTNDEFMSKANEIHGNKYDYTNVVYTSSKESIEIICKEHGRFNQIPNDHIEGKGCPKCGSKYNKLELELKDYINNLGITIIENTKNIIPPLEIDIYIPSHKIAIEFNGLYWHSELFKDKNYHLKKTQDCENIGIQLIHIFEDEWLNKKEIVKSRIKNLLGLNKTKIYARKTNIQEISNNEANDFYQQTTFKAVLTQRFVSDCTTIMIWFH